MSLKRRKKNTRQRGSTSHGWGAMKKHRGAGHRGGRGNAGSGKRGDAKKPSYWKIKNFSGKHGFTSKRPAVGFVMNAGHLSSMIDTLVTQGLAEKSGKGYAVDLEKLRIERLLGGGIVNVAMDVTVERASPSAIEKIEKAGGKVTVTAEPEAESDDAEAPVADEA